MYVPEPSMPSERPPAAAAPVAPVAAVRGEADGQRWRYHVLPKAKRVSWSKKCTCRRRWEKVGGEGKM